MAESIPIALGIASAFIMWTTTVVGLVWWLSRQFSTVRELVYKRSDMLREKMEDHERLDEERFNNLGLRLQRVEIVTDTDGRFIAPSRLKNAQ